MAENNQGVINALKESNKAAVGVIKDELKDQFKPVTDQLLAPLQQIKSGIMGLPGVGVTTKLFSAVTKPLKESFSADQSTSAKEQVAANDQARQDAKNETLMEDIRDGIMGIQKGLIEGLAGLKDKGLMGLGILAGLIAAPFAALVAFFGQLGAEVKMLDKFMKGGLSRLFRPIVKFFDAISALFNTNAKGMQGLARFERASKVFGRYTKDVFKFFDSIADAFRPITNAVKKIIVPITNAVKKFTGFVKTSTAVMDGFRPVIKFAQGIGKTLGKIFLPITILMTLIDTVKGFMDGFKEGGLIGGIEGGITGLVNSIIGMPLDLLKKAVGFILGIFGFDNAKKTLDKFSFQTLISDLIGSIFDGVKGVFGFLKNLFDFSDTSPFAIFGKLVDIVFAPLNIAINFVKGIFGFGDPKEPFSLFDFITETITEIYEWFKGLLNIDVSKIVESIPGASTVLKALGVIDETQSDLEAKIAEARDRIARSEAGENVYFGREGKGREEDAEEILQLQKELADMKAQQGNAGGTTIVNNYSSSASSNSTTVTTQSLQDAAVATGSTMN
jgi:hypothetical protein